MQNKQKMKQSLRNEIEFKASNVIFKNNFEYASAYNIPYRSQCKNLKDNICFYDHFNISKSYSERSKSMDISDVLNCPNISYFKSKTNLEQLQENNNFYAISTRNQLSNSYKSHRLLKNRDGISNNFEKIDDKETQNTSKWNPNISYTNMNENNKVLKNELFEKDSFLPQFFKSEAILINNFQKHFISSTNMDNTISIIPICKPPLSPNAIILHRNKKSVVKSNESIYPSKNNMDNNGYKILNNDDICTKDNENADESDEYEKAEEMSLLDNLNSEIMTDDLDAECDIEQCKSPTEEMLEEVHKIFKSTSVSDIKSPFIYSLFSNIPPVIRFVREGESVSLLPSQYKSKLKWKLSSITPNVVKRTVKRSGFKLINKGSQWTGYFGSHLKMIAFKSIQEHQKFNHLPGSFQIGRKDRLWRNVSILASKSGKGKEFNFLPKTYCLPGDLKLLKQAWDDEDSAKKARWILKPPASARGIGVKVINKWSQIPKKKPSIVQNYISRPFLIDGSKFDLRIYVAVTSCDPLRIYVYKNGLVRFASHKYSKSSKNISNRFIHLTNYSVNKKNENYTNNENHEKCQGHKWTLQTLWKYMEEDLKIDWKPIWKNIKDCIVKTIISIESNLNSNIRLYCTQKNCVYELFGFDILLDNKLKPWVIEVNVSPSLHSNSPLDIEVKSSMIADLFNLVGFQLFQTSENLNELPMQSRHTSFSATMISEKDVRAVQRQSSLLSLRKSATSNSSSKFFQPIDNKEIKLNKKTKSNDSLSIISQRRKDVSKQKASILYSPSFLNNSEETNDTLDMSLYQKCGYYIRALTPNEKAKHLFYIQKDVYEVQSVLATITEILTIDDVRILIESLDEFNRAGDFEIIFPTCEDETNNYITYINNNSGCRYYNILLHQFIKKFKNKNNKINIKEMIYKLVRQEGINELEKYSRHFHKDDNIILWKNPCLKISTKNNIKFRSCSAGNIIS